MADHGMSGAWQSKAQKNIAESFIRLSELSFAWPEEGNVNHPTVQIKYAVWETEADFDQGLPPLESRPVEVVPENLFDTYFAKEVIRPANTDHIDQAYKFLKERVPLHGSLVIKQV